MTDNPILAAIQATRYADAIMSRTAERLDEPHHDWQPRYKGRRMNIEKWHPPYGESHVKYHVWQAGGGDNPVIWGATHHGLAIGPKTFKSPLGLSDKDYTRTSYEHEDDPERIGRFKTPEKARAAAEQHYRDNYGTPPKHDYDIDKIMDDNPQAPTGGKGGMGDDEDYSRIFDAVRRALKQAAAALQRTATGGNMQSYWDWYSTRHPMGVHPQAMYDFAQWHQKHIDPTADKQTTYNAVKDQVAQSNGGQMPSWTNQWHHTFTDDDDYDGWHDDVGDPSNQKSRSSLDGHVSPGQKFRSDTPISQPPGHNGEGFDPDDKQDPFDPRLIGAGLHARLAAQAAAVDQGVMGRIAAELSPPCPDCGQVAGFDEHMVSPRVKVCRNCDYPMTDIGHDDLLAETLGGFDRDVANLPGTDHPTLGKHGQRTAKEMSWDDSLDYIDKVLAEGEKGNAQGDFLDAYYTSGPGAGTLPHHLVPLQHDDDYCPDCERNVAEEGHEPGFLCAERNNKTH